jgi:hypothetical protein
MQESLELNQEERYNRQVYAVSNGFLSGRLSLKQKKEKGKKNVY